MADLNDRISDPWGTRTPYGPGETWPTRIDTALSVDEAAVDRWVQAASLLHSNGDAMDIAVADGRIVGVRGRASDRVNHGRLGPKDYYAWQADSAPDRLQRPLIRQGGHLVEKLAHAVRPRVRELPQLGGLRATRPGGSR